MPLYVVQATDRPNSLELRLEHYAAHRTYIESHQQGGDVFVTMSGPLQTDDGEAMIGSLVLVEATSREAVERFVAVDPFTREGVWEDVRITRFHRRFGSQK